MRLLLLAVTCGVAVGNVYFPQGLTPLIGAPGVVPATQFGYACGIFLLVPLGDKARPRTLIVTLLVLTAASLLLAAAAWTTPVLVAASWCVGVTTVVAPIIGPMAAGMVGADRQGATGGILLSGSIAGILLARVASGAVASHLGWRAPYVVAAVLTALLALLLVRALPTTRTTTDRYSLAEPVRLFLASPALRRSCVYQSCVFAAFSAAWTTLPMLLTGPKFALTVDAVAAIGLVNAATMVCTPLAGRLVDRVGPGRVNTLCFAGTLLAAAALALGTIPSLVAGMLLLDVTMQCGMVANQTRIYAAATTTRSRMNTAYMTTSYLSGATGSWLGAVVYAHLGWPAVAVFVAALPAAALTHHLTRPANNPLATVR